MYQMWAGYLFHGGDLGAGVIGHLLAISYKEFLVRILTFAFKPTYIVEGQDDDYAKVNIFGNFHY